MSKHIFFKPTPLYKEFAILDIIEKEKKITQRAMSNHLGVSVSMINSYLDVYEENKYIKREYIRRQPLRKKRKYTKRKIESISTPLKTSSGSLTLAK